MKFGRNYHQRQIVEWADVYMNYGYFKRLCKGSVDLEELASRCTSAINSVDQFYRNKYTTLLLKLNSKARYRYPYYNVYLDSTGDFDLDDLDYFELQHHKVAFVQLSTDFDKLRWYGRVNTDGFRKILRKINLLDTNGGHISTHLENILCRLEFATQAQCLTVLKNLNKVIASIAQSQQKIPKEVYTIEHVFYTRIAKVNLSIPSLLIFLAIESDNSLELGRLIDNACSGDLQFSRVEFLHVLFECSTGCFSQSWVDVLISRAIHLDAVVVIESCLLNIIVELGWGPSKGQQVILSGHENSISLLSYMLDRLLATELNVLSKQDYLGRILLHYACEHGLVEVTEIILKSMKAWERFGAGDSKSAILQEDMEFRSPLQLSALRGHLEVTGTLISFYGNDYGSDDTSLSPRFRVACNELLLFAVRSNSTDSVKFLLGLDVDINCCDAFGQTPLYLAARSGMESMVNLLLRYKPLIDRPETTKKWTPLIIASLEGFSTIAELLVKNGAAIEHNDLSGWTAIDHASYRGHISLAKAFSKVAGNLSHKQATEIQCQLKASSKPNLPGRGQPRRTISTTESHIVVNLGSLDTSNTTTAVCLSPHLIDNTSNIHPESLFSLGVSIVGTASPSYIIPLPLLEDATNTPWIFTTTNPTQAKVAFEIFRNDGAATEGRELIGRGMSLLESYERSLDTKRESLSRDFQIPILSTVGLRYIGTVTFSFIVSTPLVLPDTPPIDTNALWFENGPSKVVGHRGILLVILRLSLLTKIGLGAKLLACDNTTDRREYYSDVQLTKDHVPVIYHDFLVCETGIDSPMHTLTYEQLMHISNEQSSQQLFASLGKARKVRALSLSASDGVETEAFMARVKHTFDYNSRGFKGNTRGDFIHEAFTTLEQLLTKLPVDIGMDIEIKYPMLSEATDDWKMDPFFIEANFFTDTVLLCLAKHISTRPILLSSFSPEICTLVALKQARWPVVFLTDAGNWQPTEVRATNLQEGVRFAKKWDLDGLALASEPFVLAPQLVEFVKGKGMICATYGALNDEVEGFTIQAKAGVDAIIVNNVRLASETRAVLQGK